MYIYMYAYASATRASLHAIAYFCFTVGLSRNLIGFAANSLRMRADVVVVAVCVGVCVCAYAQFIHFVILMPFPEFSCGLTQFNSNTQKYTIHFLRSHSNCLQQIRTKN